MNTNTMQCRVIASTVAAFSFALLYPSTARADTPAQTQKAIQAVCSRTAASYAKRDLSSFIAMYSPSFTLRNVAGRSFNFRQNQADIANTFAKDNLRASAVCTVSQVVSQGSQAQAVLHWHYVFRTKHGTLSYMVTRDYQEQSLWKKTAGGWQEVSADMTHDTVDYRR